MPQFSSKSLSKEDRRALLSIARQAIIEAIVHGRTWKPVFAQGALAESRGVFVTLEHRGKLRGCVGQVVAPDLLAHAVAHCAVAAARDDSRFTPVRPNEVTELAIEISALSSLEPIRAEEIEIGLHGLMVASGPIHGLLLPQVAVEHRWTRERFLQETCEKAGLPGDAWKSAETKLFGFTAELFSEADQQAMVSDSSLHSEA
jgi:AmmeMemoRadiSam system protein A